MISSVDSYIERLKQIQDNTVSLFTILPEDEPRFKIDLNRRVISIPDEFKFLGVLNETSAETIYFEMDRFFDNVDLSIHTIVVQFLSSGEENDRSEGIYPVTSVDVDTLPGKIIFGWTIKSEVTLHAQDVSFAVRIYSLEESETNKSVRFSYCLNTTPASLPVISTLNVSNTVTPEDPSYLDQWLQKMNEIGKQATQAVHDAENFANNADQSAKNAEVSKQSAQKSEESAIAAAAKSEENALLAEESAIRAEQSAANAGWFSIEDEDGVLYFLRSDNSTDDIELVDDGDGVLEVIYG